MTLLSETLLSDAAEGNPEAQERLLGVHEPLLRSVAARTLSHEYIWELADAQQTSRIALLQSVSCYTRVEGVSFSTFAWRVALRACLRERALYHRGFVLPQRVKGEHCPALVEIGAEDAPVPPPDDAVMHSITVRRALALLAQMDAIDRRVLTLRFGLAEGDALTQSAVALRCGVSQQAIGKCEERALRRLRTMMGD